MIRARGLPTCSQRAINSYTLSPPFESQRTYCGRPRTPQRFVRAALYDQEGTKQHHQRDTCWGHTAALMRGNSHMQLEAHHQLDSLPYSLLH